jgi:hypothetical protein
MSARTIILSFAIIILFGYPNQTLFTYRSDLLREEWTDHKGATSNQTDAALFLYAQKKRPRITAKPLQN